MLELPDDFEEILYRWSKSKISVARKAQKAQKAGVVICLGESLSEWKDYYEVYQSSIIRWGEKITVAYSWDLFSILQRRSSPNIKLWLAKYNGIIIAGAVCFYAPNHAVYWHGAACSEYFNLRPVNLLLYEAIKDATKQGFTWFDFNPSGGLEGVKAFKHSFGAIPLSSNIVTLTSWKMKMLSGLAKLVRRKRK
jgi:predicted N-acyltransferase